ncbi:MAG: AAA family ATPase, partial [Anaerolineales bacterium]|nr:AAA family ATPase [Anaerolineales bacterium]
IMTSNLGTEYVSRSGSLGFLDSSASDKDIEARDKINKALKDAFRPEFLNRIDEIITFSPLTKQQMVKIVDLQLIEVDQRLADNGLEVSLTKKARLWLAEQGYSADFGARPLTRALQKFIESPLSKKLLEGEYKDGGVILVDVDPENEDQLIFTNK